MSQIANLFVAFVPDRIQAALIARAAEIEYPIETVIEMAIASFQGHRGIRFCRLKTRTRAVKRKPRSLP
ncbi:MAG: hypothetical protein ACRC62_07265 [Microcoleus sp.]